VLDAARERQRDALARLEIALRVELDPAVAMVSGRRGELVNLFSRLLRFAQVRLEDSLPPRRITWTARQFGAGLVVTQVDSGPPLPAAFEAVRVDYFRPADEQFLGHVEIALAQRLAENCHAGLAVAGAPDAGAEVTVTLIPGELHRSVPASRLAGRRDASQSSILVADDDAANRRAIGQLLERQGHRVVLAADGVEAQHALEQQDFDVIITDLQMPRLSGQDLYEAVLRTAPRLARRFVFVTGDDVRSGSQAFLSESRGITVRKPFALDELLAAVEEATHRG
jgi:CheY-like chemotaxis protein